MSGREHKLKFLPDETILFPKIVKVIQLRKLTMNKEFYQYIFEKQQRVEAVPPTKDIALWASKVLHLLFPEQSQKRHPSAESIDKEFRELEAVLHRLMDSTTACNDCNNELKAKQFFENIPELYRVLSNDITAILNGDPAARSTFEIIRTYPGF